MCSIETNWHEDPANPCNSKKSIMNVKNNRRCTLSDNITFRHRHRRYLNGDELQHDSKLKCCGFKRKTLSSSEDENTEVISNKYSINSSSLKMSRNNYHVVILAITLVVSVMVNVSSAFNSRDIRAKYVRKLLVS